MEHINLEDFLNNRRKCEIKMGEKKWVFQEPTIEELLNIKSIEDANSLANSMIVEGDEKEFDQLTNKMTIDSKNNLYKDILSKLGLDGRLQKK